MPSVLVSSSWLGVRRFGQTDDRFSSGFGISKVPTNLTADTSGLDGLSSSYPQFQVSRGVGSEGMKTWG